MTRARLHLSHDPPANRLSALEFGRVDDGQPEECWERVADDLGLLHDEPGGRCVGFLLVDLAGYDTDAPEHADLWERPRFDVPALGLTDVAPNAVIVAARALYGDGRSINRELFSAACNACGEDALELWLRCLQAGDSMAHQALGYTLYELGRLPEAYRHTRHYCEIAPAEPWAWCWFGKVAAAMGEDAEAAVAFERAIELEDDDEPTDAAELLDRLRAGDVDVPRLRAAAPAPDLGDLADMTHLDHELRTTGDGGFVLFDTAPIPAWLDCDDDGALRVRAEVGYVPWDDMERWGDDAEDFVMDRLMDLDVEHDVLLVDDTLWLSIPLDERVGDIGRRELQFAVHGVAAEALRVRSAYLGDWGEHSLGDLLDYPYYCGRIALRDASDGEPRGGGA